MTAISHLSTSKNAYNDDKTVTNALLTSYAWYKHITAVKNTLKQ